MSPTNLEFDRLLREFGYDVRSHSVRNDAVLRAQDRDLPEVSAFSDVVQGEIAKAVESSWWYRVRNEIIVKNLRRRGISGTLWDVGSGTGVVTAALVAAGIPAIAIEPSTGGPRSQVNMELSQFKELFIASICLIVALLESERSMCSNM